MIYIQGSVCAKQVPVHYLVILCSSLQSSNLANGHVVANGRLLGNTTEYRCNEGYELIGDSRKRCQQDETWTGVEPTCRSKQERYSKTSLNYCCIFQSRRAAFYLCQGMAISHLPTSTTIAVALSITFASLATS